MLGFVGVFCDVYFGIWWFVGFRFYVGTLGFLGVGGGLTLGVVGWYFLWFWFDGYSSLVWM